MGCFIVPAAEAVVTTIAGKIVKSNEKEAETIQVSLDGMNTITAEKIPFSRKLKWLSNLLWGGSGLLAFEHLWHGEVVPFFPFLSAANDPADLLTMLQEMSTVGSTMALLVTGVWVGMLAITSAAEKKAIKRPLEN